MLLILTVTMLPPHSVMEKTRMYIFRDQEPEEPVRASDEDKS